MPFTVSSADLPDHVKQLPSTKKAQWVEVFNSALAKCEEDGGGDCEATASRQANGAVTESYVDDILVLDVERDTAALGFEMGTVQEISERHDENTDYEGATIDMLREMLDTLREQPVIKYEAGHKFPPEAYAEVVDPEKPATWKCRLWKSPESGVRRKQLDSVIKEATTTTLKARLRAEYRALNVAEHNIPKAVMEVEPMERIAGRELLQIQEGAFDEAKNELEVTVIKKGFNVSERRFYPGDMLKRDKDIFQGVKMFADHPDKNEEHARPERSIKNEVAVAGPITVGSDGELRTRAKLIAPWFIERCKLMQKQGVLNTMGVSIVALGEGVKAKVEGKTTNMIERLVKARSVDFVTYAGAGGFVECFESAEHAEDADDVDLIDADRFIERRPDVVEIIESQTRATLAQEKGDMSGEIEAKDKKIATLTEANEGLTATNKGLQESVDATAAKDAKTEVDKLIAEAELPEPVKAKLTERFKEAVSADGVKEAVEAETKCLETLTEAGIVKGCGDTVPIDEAEAKEQDEQLYENAVDRFMGMGKTKEVAESMARNFVKGV